MCISMEINQSNKESNHKDQAPSSSKDVQDNKVIAALSYIWILSIIFLLVKKDSPFVQFHAKQGVVIFAGSFILSFIPIIGWFLNIVLFVMALMGLIAAAQGQKKELPIIFPIAEKINL